MYNNNGLIEILSKADNTRAWCNATETAVAVAAVSFSVRFYEYALCIGHKHCKVAR